MLSCKLSEENRKKNINAFTFGIIEKVMNAA